MDRLELSEYSSALGLELVSLEIIQENKYCVIYLGNTNSGKCIVKKYRGEDPALVRIEAEALAFYHELAKDDELLIDSRSPILNEEKNILCIGFVEGERFSDFICSARRDPALQARAFHHMRTLGKLLRTIYEQTKQPKKETDPLIFEYFDYSSRRLEENKWFGSAFFKGYQKSAEKISDKFRQEKITPSFVHGDLVFKNIHVNEKRLGLIDFANAIYLSHPLNDIYNLKIALANMVLKKRFKSELMSNFFQGFGSVEFPEIAHEFYFEYQRRRWLMLKLSWFHVKEWLQGFRALATFAKPYRNKVQPL